MTQPYINQSQATVKTEALNKVLSIVWNELDEQKQEAVRQALRDNRVKVDNNDQP